jgi:hypothetical protein
MKNFAAGIDPKRLLIRENTGEATMKNVLLATAAFALAAAASPSHAQPVTTKDQLLGSWKVLSLKATTGNKITHPLGEGHTRHVVVPLNQ